MALPERARRILAALVSEYIETAEPVASQTVLKRGGFDVSSATIRNVLARLEDEGYVRQPHTSAGRVPTDRGYRTYVDMLLEGRRPGRPPSSVEAQLRQHSGASPLMSEVLARASHMLWEVSHHIGFAIGPEPEVAAFHQIDFVPLHDSRVLVVFVARGEVTQKVVDIGETLTGDQLRQAANYLNSRFSGMRLSDVRAAVVVQLQEEQALYDALLARALRLAHETFDNLWPPHTTMFVEGASSLVELEPGADISMATLRTLLRMIEDKHRLVRLLTEYIDAAGLRVVIGTEHRSPDLRECSVVAATYFDGQRHGTIGVIGPTRMRYPRAISAVDGVAKAVSRVFEQSWGPLYD